MHNIVICPVDIQQGSLFIQSYPGSFVCMCTSLWMSDRKVGNPNLHARHPAPDVCTLPRYDIGAPQQVSHMRFQGAAHVCMQIGGDARDAMVCGNTPRLSVPHRELRQCAYATLGVSVQASTWIQVPTNYDYSAAC